MGKPGKKAGKGLLAPTNPNRRTDPNKTSLRDQRTIKRLKMYKSKIKRDEKGNIIKGSVLKASDRIEQQMARIAPDRRWFGNTRTIGQEALQKFREEMGAKYRDPYSVIIKQSKLPLSLLEEPKNTDESIRKEMEWDKTFGDKANRKRVRLHAVDMSTLATEANSKGDYYDCNKKEKDRDLMKGMHKDRDDKTRNGILMTKGQSNRIWCELYKVIDSSDVVLYVVDARDPMGTRSAFLEDFMRREKKYKHFVLVLNKCDLVPLWATARWLQILSKDYPTIAFHASVNHPFGKGNVISLLRQFARLHNVTHRGSKRTKTPISVGVIGYPNVGKSSLINTLRRKSVCKVAPIPGETKVWQYVALTRSIFLIDCPGVVYDRESNNDIQAVLKGVVRVERLGNADKTDVVDTVLKIVKHRDIVATYGVREWRDVVDFLEKLAKLRGKLVAGGEPDVEAAARMVLYDWQRGRLPWFNAPPFESNKHHRDAMEQPQEKQMKLIEHYSTFNVVDDTINRGDEEQDEEDDGDEETVNDAAEEDQFDSGSEAEKEEEAVKPSKLSKTDRLPSRKAHTELATVATYMREQEEKQRRAQRQQKRKAARKEEEDVEAFSADADRESDDALWAQFLAAAKD
ncbi:putative GTPase [Leishmania mexicana MHOM/GT/2001/U1103]|uniref:Nucleolar GTP-binding protein 2 n=1 Tax=Leishmania mexicana (strain MHOM/GT/2001/U1103) TaxID=929439 RepID=E9AKF2_LEIMU|nr:putative GTPase [Leishmania mexicana MHOM/GT/2001/U1103]CBZ23403.1 putative GTPase [Leishmania mexicana MHOM/GT/2001/U1103]